MGWIEDLHGQTISLDSAPLIYYIEEHPDYGKVLDPFFEAVAGGDISLVTSTVTLLEVLVQPLRKGDEALAHSYNDILLSSPNITTLPVTPTTAQLAAELRAEGKLKTPDSIHLATAINHNATTFLTNDRDFGEIDSLQVLRVSDLLGIA